jgi:hypothetical protein
VFTHGGFNRETSAATETLGTLGSALENMLGCLTAQDAGRDQVTGVVAWADKVAACKTQGEALIAEANARHDPVADAIGAAGGVDQVANAAYYAEL